MTTKPLTDFELFLINLISEHKARFQGRENPKRVITERLEFALNHTVFSNPFTTKLFIDTHLSSIKQLFPMQGSKLYEQRSSELTELYLKSKSNYKG
jgi:hypothetical protein